MDPGSGAGKVIKFLPVVFLENRELCSGPWGPLPGSTNFSNFDSPGITYYFFVKKTNQNIHCEKNQPNSNMVPRI